MAENKKKKSSKAPLVILIIVTILLGALIAACIYFAGFGDKPGALYRTIVDPAVKAKEEIERENGAVIEEYNNEVLRIEQANQELYRVNRPAPAATGWSLVDVTGFDPENRQSGTVSRQELLLGGGVLVNYWHSVPADMPEDQLVSLQNYLERRWKVGLEGAGIKVYPVAANALDQMLTAAKEEGLEDYIIENAFRTWSAQQESWDKEAALNKYSQYAGEVLREKVNAVVAYPGTSEYQSGFSVCLQRYRAGEAEFNKNFAGTEHSAWLLENSWKYGFVFRFPVAGYPAEDTVDKSWITGRNNRMSVYRYIGHANAAVMHVEDWCMEEYYEYLCAHPHIELYENGELKYEVVRVAYNGGASADILYSGNCKTYEVTMDNLGGVIIGMTY